MTKIGRYIITIVLLLAATSVAFAQESIIRPSFPTCTAPQGEMKVDYPEGTHGIPGDAGNYTGRDTVYTLSEDTLAQCFCSSNGNGIQTNWWKISSLSFDEVEILRKEGWVYIPNGAVWGLKEDPYMALSSPYACGPKKEDKDENDDDDDDDDNNSNDNDDSEGDVLGAYTTRIGGLGDVLGLASTGNTSQLVLLAILSTVFLSATVLLFKNSTKHEN